MALNHGLPDVHLKAQNMMWVWLTMVNYGYLTMEANCGFTLYLKSASERYTGT